VDQVRIYFNGNYFTGAFEQGFSERSFAGTDFDHQWDAIAAGGRGDAIQNGFSEKKVLAETATHVRLLL
jgi:hypothetical protein